MRRVAGTGFLSVFLMAERAFVVYVLVRATVFFQR